MYKHSVHNILMNNKIYDYCFKTLSLRNTIFSTSARYFEIISLVSITTSLIMYIYGATQSFSSDEEIPSYIPIYLISSFFFGLGSHQISVLLSRSFLKKNYPEYKPLMNNKLFRYNGEVLFAIRCDKLYLFLKNNKFHSEDLDSLIQYYSDHGDSIKKRRWTPIAIFTTLAFPIWNTTVSRFFYTDEIIFMLIIPLSIFLLVLLIWNTRNMIEQLFFTKETNNLEIAKILKTIKSFPKF